MTDISLRQQLFKLIIELYHKQPRRIKTNSSHNMDQFYTILFSNNNFETNRSIIMRDLDLTNLTIKFKDPNTVSNPLTFSLNEQTDEIIKIMILQLI